MSTNIDTSNSQLAIQNDRVRQHTSSSVNNKIDRETIERIKDYCDRSDSEIAERLKKLNQEWDTERVLEANASILAFSGLILGITVSPNWFWLPGVVLPFLFQHAIQGWCPPLFVIRRLGVRTLREIERERYALKILRGDFAELSKVDQNRDSKVDSIWQTLNA